MADVDKWIEIAKECKYLPEGDLKVRYCLTMFFHASDIKPGEEFSPQVVSFIRRFLY